LGAISGSLTSCESHPPAIGAGSQADGPASRLPGTRHVSDPDDLAILYAIESSSGTRETLVDAFGVHSDQGISAYLGRLLFAALGP